MADKPEKDRGFTVRALGEVAIRCADIGAMEAFYRDMIGLRPLKGGHRGYIRFFEIGPGYGGHTTVLALFASASGRDAPAAGDGSSLHHVALTVGAEEQEAAIEWFARSGIEFRIEEFDWIGWRGVFVADPEGNTVELVAKVGPPSA